MKSPLLHAHLENLSSKPPIFQLTPELVRIARRHNSDLNGKVRFTVGEDFADLDERLKTARVLVTSSDAVRDPRFPRRHLAKAAPNIRLLQLIGAGVEGLLPLDWLPSSVRLANASGVHVAKAREFLLMALLALNARLPAIVSNQRQAHWDMIFTSLIRGKTLLVIGLGRMGRAAVEAGRTLGLEVIGIRRSGKKVPGVERVYRPAQLAAVVAKADFIVVAAPLTPDTRNLLSGKVLRKTKAGVGIVNIGRAGVIDYPALAKLLRSGHVSGAILDVFDQEPLPPTSELWATPNLIVSPHVSSDDLDGYMLATMNLVCRNLRRLISGRPFEAIAPRLGHSHTEAARFVPAR